MPRKCKDVIKNSNVQNFKETSVSKYFFESSAKSTRKRNSERSVNDKVPSKTSRNDLLEIKPTEAPMETSGSNFIESSSTISDNKYGQNKLTFFSYSKKKDDAETEGRKLTKNEKKDDCLSFVIPNTIVGDDNLEDKFSHSPSSLDTNLKYTPLEKQYLEFKEKYPDAVLLIECGYKYRFFGKDAQIAKQDLNIGCFQCHNFLSASIPVHRLNFHVRRLVLKGHKVGVIKQTESAALKAIGDTRNELFTRKLHAMYTRSTFMEEESYTVDDGKYVEVETCDENDAGSGFLMCISELQNAKKEPESASVAFVAVEVSSGDIFYSAFQNSFMQNELESFLSCLNPTELLVPSCPLSKNTEKVLEAFSSNRSVRIERLDEKFFNASFSHNSMTSFISKANADQSSSEVQENLQLLVILPPLVISCLSALKVYLSDFKVDHVLKNVKNYRLFTENDKMILSAATLRGLEILQSSGIPHHTGTLFWSINQACTRFGERLLKSWLLQPLKDIIKIEERLHIVTEIIQSDSVIFKKISNLFYKLPDLERLLCSAFYHKCSCNDFLKLVKALSAIHKEFLGLTDKIKTEIKVGKLQDILLRTVEYLNGVEKYASNIDPSAAKDGNKVDLFLDTREYGSLELCKSKIIGIEKKLNELRPSICKILRLPAMKYATVAGQKYLIEVPQSHQSLVPYDWLKISVTKQVSRFRSPEVIDLCKELEQDEARLKEFANEAWNSFLDDFGKEFHKYKCAIFHLAELDCFFSLAKVSKDESYCRPIITDSEDRKFEIQQGRHPMVSKFMGMEKQFVANDTKLNSTMRCLIVTGPNMGGKSTYIRQTALIAILAHIGCYVPAESATIPLLDGIHVRMGAEDDIVSRKSTFMIEMSEASQILSSATSKSLVIFDELGRGTSTNDGAAIAYTTLKYLIQKVNCLTLFVTHYPSVVEIKDLYPKNICTVHMGFILKDMDDEDDLQRVVFLYNVVEGVSESSYGINVAALAGIPKNILKEAQRKSKEMELKAKIQRQLQILSKKLRCKNYEQI